MPCFRLSIVLSYSLVGIGIFVFDPSLSSLEAKGRDRSASKQRVKVKNPKTTKLGRFVWNIGHKNYRSRSAPEPSAPVSESQPGSQLTCSPGAYVSDRDALVIVSRADQLRRGRTKTLAVREAASSRLRSVSSQRSQAALPAAFSASERTSQNVSRLAKLVGTFGEPIDETKSRAPRVIRGDYGTALLRAENAVTAYERASKDDASSHLLAGQKAVDELHRVSRSVTELVDSLKVDEMSFAQERAMILRKLQQNPSPENFAEAEGLIKKFNAQTDQLMGIDAYASNWLSFEQELNSDKPVRFLAVGRDYPEDPKQWRARLHAKIGQSIEAFNGDFSPRIFRMKQAQLK